MSRANLSLPETFASELRALYSWRRPSAELCATLAAAKGRGWSLTCLGEALGITRERVRQLAETAETDQPITLDIPDLPARPEPERRVIPTLTDEQAEQLRELCGRGRMWHGKNSAQSISASRESARLIQAYLDAGHRIIDLARSIGVTYAAVHLRLARHGYRPLPPSIPRPACLVPVGDQAIAPEETPC